MPERRGGEFDRLRRHAPGGAKGLRSYKVRRAFIGALKGADVHPKIVQELLGHASVFTAVDMMKKEGV